MNIYFIYVHTYPIFSDLFRMSTNCNRKTVCANISFILGRRYRQKGVLTTDITILINDENSFNNIHQTEIETMDFNFNVKINPKCHLTIVKYMKC